MSGPLVNVGAVNQVVGFVNAGVTFYNAIQAFRANPTQANFNAAGQALAALVAAYQTPGVQAALATGWAALNTAVTALRAFFRI